jgi:hypothetical protein
MPILLLAAFIHLRLAQGPNGTALVVIVALAQGFMLWNQRARFVKAGLDAAGGKNFEYRFDARGCSVKTSDSEWTSNWSALHRHAQTEQAFLLYTSPRLATIIPKRAFSPADRALLATELASRVAPPKGSKDIARQLLIWAVLIIGFLLFLRFSNG